MIPYTDLKAPGISYFDANRAVRIRPRSGGCEIFLECGVTLDASDSADDIAKMIGNCLVVPGCLAPEDDSES